jgi:hypothetical protein
VHTNASVSEISWNRTSYFQGMTALRQVFRRTTFLSAQMPLSAQVNLN